MNSPFEDDINYQIDTIDLGKVRDLFLYKPKKRFDMVSSIGVLHHTNNCINGLRHIFNHLEQSFSSHCF